MYDYFIKAISLRNYNLPAILEKIKVSWAAGEITDENRVELEEMAKESANPEQSLPGISERVTSLEKSLKEVISRLDALDSPDEEPEEYPAFTEIAEGIGAYFQGDKISFGDKKYVSKVDGIAYDPDTYPNGWEEVQDDE